MPYTDLKIDLENDADGRELHDRRPSRSRTTLETVEITQVKGGGFKTSGNVWRRFSKFAMPSDVVLPSVGDTVLLVLDQAGFVRRIERVGKSHLI